MAQPEEMIPVMSSNLSAIGYDKEEQELWIDYKSGFTYCFSGVPEGVFMQLKKANSKGQYIDQVVSQNYSYTRM